MLTVFEKTYDGESIVDLYRDVAESIDGSYNDIVNEIPQDKHGFQLGEFKVTITWENNEEI